MDLNDIQVNQVQWKQYSILVVDDEPGMLSFLQRALFHAVAWLIPQAVSSRPSRCCAGVCTT